jgi:hypothetical protein
MKCPFCPHERHDERECGAIAGSIRRPTDMPCECVGPNEAERAAIDMPEKILDWLYLILENEALSSSLVTDVKHFDGRLELETKAGRFNLRIERAS